MKNHAIFIYSDKFKSYKFGNDHPFNQKRIDMTYDLLNTLKAFESDQVIPPRIATDEEISLFHDPSFINAVKKAGNGELSEEIALHYGLGTEDTPIFPNMHEASALLVGGTIKAVEMVMEGKATHALNLGGGLHHGFAGKASGFCVYNDSAIAIQYILKKYKKKVLYIDTDVHHGDGVQWAFYDSKEVCTLSLHETGRYLFPGTGNVNERGVGEGYGFSFNIPLDAFTENESFLEVYKEAMNEVTRYFKPDIIITQNGADAHYYDPLSHLYLTTEAYREIPKIAHEIAHQYTDGKWVAVGGGGYDIWRVVPRAWSLLWLEMNQLTSLGEGELPEEWLQRWQREAPVALSTTWHDKENLYPIVPRMHEITEKNYNTLLKALTPVRDKEMRNRSQKI